MLKANPVADFEPKWGQGVLNGERFVRMAYPSIAKHEERVKLMGNRSVGW